MAWERPDGGVRQVSFLSNENIKKIETEHPSGIVVKHRSQESVNPVPYKQTQLKK